MTKIKNTDQLSAEILAPLIEHCEKKHGAVAELHRKFNEGLKEKASPATFHRWLTSDKKLRSEPSAGNFLRLCELWKEVSGKQVEGSIIAEPTIYCIVNGCAGDNTGLKCKRCNQEL